MMKKVGEKMDINKLFANNVSYVLGQRKIKIGDFEREMGVSVGYFSRNRHANSSNAISITLAYKIAQKLELSLDELCSDIKLSDLERSAETYGFKLVPITEEDE